MKLKIKGSDILKVHLQSKIIFDSDKEIFEKEVNDFLEYLGGRVKDIQYQVTSNLMFSVMITYWC